MTANIVRLAKRMVRDDLTYAAGSVLSANDARGAHPKLWPFLLWGVMVAFEGRKWANDTGSAKVELDWEDDIAEAARHSGKFFDNKGLQLHGVLNRFQSLIDSNHLAYFPANRLGREYDFLRHDLSVILSGGEVVLTNLSGLFMMGIHPDDASSVEAVTQQGKRLSYGVGQAATVFSNVDPEIARRHGNRDLPEAEWKDATLSLTLPSIYGGRLRPPTALALMTIHATVQAARLWTSTDCCEHCDSAARKHRFIVLYQALKSITILVDEADWATRSDSLRVAEILKVAGGATLLSAPFRRLRNGLLHLGVGDVVDRLPADPQPSDLVPAYTNVSAADLDEIVKQGLEQFASRSNAWMLEPGPDGSTLFDHLVEPS